ncbi:hypothetical protein [Streptomyces sp. NPDC058401]|uniref:hypothetical protein n=1 Tax=Streptomyces sp. NPDC058401 TaxID=3346480 RepID=UPI00365140D1
MTAPSVRWIRRAFGLPGERGLGGEVRQRLFALGALAVAEHFEGGADLGACGAAGVGDVVEGFGDGGAVELVGGDVQDV